jgi:tetrahydromethanopterin S-methyltransferase subunit F
MTRGSKRNITEWRGNLSIGASSTGTTGGEAGLVFIFLLLLVLLVGLPHLV